MVFPPHERGKAIGAWAGAVGGAVALGPVLGGLLLENPQWTSWLTGNDWGGVFLINVPDRDRSAWSASSWWCRRRRTRTRSGSTSPAW